jgi:hypothetical protein
MTARAVVAALVALAALATTARAEAPEAYWLRARWDGVEWAARYRIVVDNGGAYRIVTDVGEATGAEIEADAFGAFPTGWVRVTVEAVAEDGRTVPSNAIWLPPTVPVCEQADLDGDNTVTATDGLILLEAVATGSCDTDAQ